MQKPKTLEEACDAIAELDRRLVNIEKFIAMTTNMPKFTNAEIKAHYNVLKTDLAAAEPKSGG